MDTIILEKGDLVDLWPGKNNAYKCICLDKDNTRYEDTIPKAKCELLITLNFLRQKLNQDDIIHLAQQIEEYGNEQYAQGNYSGDE